jgi:hypothetical protein
MNSKTLLIVALVLLGCCALSGCGSGGSPSVSLSTKSLTFGDELEGTTSEPLPITLTNSGNATLTVASIVASANFVVTNNCGATLAAGANCIINVTLAPTISGSATGTVSFTDNAAGSPQTVSLSGTGTAPSTLTGSCFIVNVGPDCVSIQELTQCPVGKPAVSPATYSCGIRETPMAVDTSSPCGNERGERGYCEATPSAGSCSVQGQQCGAAGSSPCCSGFVCTTAADGSFCQPTTGESASRARSSWDERLADRLR